MSRRRLLFALVIIAVAIVLRFVPRPEAQVQACYFAPSPAICDLMLVPLVGSETTADQVPHEVPRDCEQAAMSPDPLTPRCQLHFFWRACDRGYEPGCVDAAELRAQGVQP